MTTTMTPSIQAIGEWTKLFPKQVTENYTSSVTFMKQLTVVALSTITYLKNVFPEDCYMPETFGGLNLRILKKECDDELGQFLSTALASAFDAFDKRYLHQLALCFYEEECKIENLIEYHIFEYTYNEDGVTMNLSSKSRGNVKRKQKCTFDNVRESTVRMIRACFAFQCQGDLPTSYDISIRLYYNDDAPEGYQAPGFLTSDSEDHLQPTVNETTKLGGVETPYHKVVAKCYMRDNWRASHEAIASQNPPEIPLTENDDFGTRAGEIRCPCNKFDSDTALLTCWYCQTKQHSVCFGVRGDLHARHCCEICSSKDQSRVCTDQTLVTLTRMQQMCLCIFRRALDYCSKLRSVGTDDLMQQFEITDANATKLMKKLQSHGIVERGADNNLATPREIVTDKLNSVMSEFFRSSEEETIVNRLLAETFASQESQSDPIGDVLSPMEMISLQNASNLGRVIDKPVDNQNTEDWTLKQYRDALLLNNNDVEDMPLSGSHNPVQDMDKIGKRTPKRKVGNGDERSILRPGVRTKRARVLPK